MDNKIFKGHKGKNQWTIYPYDCIKAMKQIPDESIDCIITSPPYLNKRSYGQVGREQGNKAMYKYAASGKPLEYEIGCNQNIDEYFNSINQVFKLCYVLLKPDKFFFFNIGNLRRNKETTDISHIFVQMAKDIGFKHRDTIIWVKNNPRPVPPNSEIYWLDNGWEYLLMFSKGTGTIDREKYDLTVKNNCKVCKTQQEFEKTKPNYFKTNIGYTEESIKHEHPAKFPLSLPRFVLQLCTKENDTILDPFAGVGTTLIAGLQLNRNVIGCELNYDYCEKAVDEIKKTIFIINKP
ncbi:hypothetical protein SYNTR_1744 [Candidatus Syntrophocurvum alkaliphilum]|uniref:Methyltransferase n=1 Tax=Candidatus Syntrophocurvum alkaliphilum TaxID=2293317 RepID=A0A6I6DJY9_9FIRM|nr:site-specific DNA-methyltransferase [Candidatus Syntrophocurvum alkaliphilum]QGU00338.1 hypothetical protein SYNTR_1744 [Candidatus Syntrophocurvum alkaliphilum]